MRSRLASTVSAALLVALLHAASAQAVDGPTPADAPVYDIPHVSNLTIDGSADDWHDRGLFINLGLSDDGVAFQPADLTASARVAWDERGLIILLDVTDDAFIEAPEAAAIWERDCIELFLADHVGSDRYYQALISPGMTPDQSNLRFYTWSPAGTIERPLELQAARTKLSSNRYVAEMLLPWSNLDRAAEQGMELGLQIYVGDADDPAKNRWHTEHAVWFPAVLTYADPHRMHRVRLHDQPSPPVRVNVELPAKFETSLTLAVASEIDIARLHIPDTTFESEFIPHEGDARTGTLRLRSIPADLKNHWLPIMHDEQVAGHLILGNPFPNRSGPPLGDLLPSRTLPATTTDEPRIASESNEPPSFLIAATGVVVVIVVAGSLLVWRSQKLTINNF